MKKQNIGAKSYFTFKQAVRLVQKLQITKWSEYNAALEANPRLPVNPSVFYKDEWIGSGGGDNFFSRIKKYDSIISVKDVVKKLGIKNWKTYWERYKEDPRLPRNPNLYFPTELAENGGAPWLFETEEQQYETWEDAAKAAYKLNINCLSEYKKRYKEDPKLPSNLASAYPEDWKRRGKSYAFFGKNKAKFYKTFEAARKSVKKLKITDHKDYAERRHLDAKLPSSPSFYYKNEWESCGGGFAFFNRSDSEIYPTWEMASAAARDLGIKSIQEYAEKYNQDPKLRRKPALYYPDVWNKNGGINGFLNIERFYKTLEDVINAVERLGIKSIEEYRARHHEDSKLPAYPESAYSVDGKINKNFRAFFTKPKRELYSTLDEAKIATANLNIKNILQYKENSHKDPLLPLNPQITYKNEWTIRGGRKWFFDVKPKLKLPIDEQKPFLLMEEAKAIVCKLGIASLEEYKTRYIESDVLPKNIVVYYGAQWKEAGGSKVFFAKKCEYYSKRSPNHTIDAVSIVNLLQHFQTLPTIICPPDI